MTFKLALAQFSPCTHLHTALEQNLQTHLRLMQAAHAQGVSLLVFPELSLSGYELAEAVRLAVTPTHPVLKHIQTLVDACHISVIVGAPLFNEAAPEKPYIASFLLRHHLPAQVYCKMHLHAGEDRFVSVGSETLLFELQGRRIGMAICADALYDSHAQHYADLQADVYVASVLITESGYASDCAQLQHCACQHGMLVAMANYSGFSGGYMATGKSCVFSPTGAFLGVAATTTEMKAHGLTWQLLMLEHSQGQWQSSVYPALLPEPSNGHNQQTRF
ncbi:carbon-nitrogen hydrolase family protein [Vitreoscilla massiliensis]|uniref:Carbon-nitrogen hydrolase family protein n=1 Tax=Vitreoscilla massiliensis TaxID=1689272 RepID=A0ABY4E4J3_9NEIS|nr:carbon-nitrogen hydrolase family protein [Vitreoscilla massiliensis]UOO89208.1 carbon-nitrogen hydrolase family protein [Vitreoscilla massiliensis]